MSSHATEQATQHEAQRPQQRFTFKGRFKMSGSKVLQHSGTATQLFSCCPENTKNRLQVSALAEALSYWRTHAWHLWWPHAEADFSTRGLVWRSEDIKPVATGAACGIGPQLSPLKLVQKHGVESAGRWLGEVQGNMGNRGASMKLSQSQQQPRLHTASAWIR